MTEDGIWTEQGYVARASLTPEQLKAAEARLAALEKSARATEAKTERDSSKKAGE